MSNVQLASVEIDNTAGAEPTYDLATPITAPTTPRQTEVNYVLRNKGTANAYVRFDAIETETAIVILPTGYPVSIGPYLLRPDKAALPKLLLETGAHIIVTPTERVR